MTLEGIEANFRDWWRLYWLELHETFKPPFAKEAAEACKRYVTRILELAAMDRIIPYPGPTITEN